MSKIEDETRRPPPRYRGRRLTREQRKIVLADRPTENAGAGWTTSRDLDLIHYTRWWDRER